MSTTEDQPVLTSVAKKRIAVKKNITKPSLSYLSTYASPLGTLLIRHNAKSIQQLQYVSLDQSEQSSQKPLPAVWRVLLDRYFSGDYVALQRLPVQLDSGTIFQQQVWLGIRKIKAGETISYLQLAQRIDRPRAVRAVGQALKKNPIPLILPCHRVIQQSGKLGGYEGDLLSTTGRKQFLLWHEGIFLSNKK
jgi:methylated-DNA-[protein]-cysteine S-methyltransferase